MGEAQAQDSGSWLEDILSPVAPLSSAPPAPAPATNIHGNAAGTKSPTPGYVPPSRTPATAEWKRLLANVRGLRPELLNAMTAIQQLGAVLIKGEHRYFFGRGSTLTVDGFEHVISTLYFTVIGKKTAGAEGEPVPGSVGEMFWGLRRQGARLKESGEAGLTLSRGIIGAGDWELIKQDMLQPNRDIVLRLQREAREEVNFVLRLSSLAKVTGDKDVEWQDM